MREKVIKKCRSPMVISAVVTSVLLCSCPTVVKAEELFMSESAGDEVHIAASCGQTGEKASQRTATGHDNSNYRLHFSVQFQMDESTSDWVAYVPIPKEGKSVFYQHVEDNVGSIRKTPASQISMNLTGPVAEGDAPAGSEIAYTTDADPAYVLNASETGNYRQEVEDWSKVTMVRVRLLELAPQEIFYLNLNLTCDKKTSPGTLCSYSSGYYNLKLGNDSDYYYGEQGGYSSFISYEITDYHVSGHVWEEMKDPSDDIWTEEDRPVSGIEVRAEGADGAVWNSMTDDKGDYSLVIPSGGAYELRLLMPDERYEFVKADAGDYASSSRFSPGTGSSVIELYDHDLAYQNAGLWGRRELCMEEDIYIVQGETKAVTAEKFPEYVQLIWQQAEDEDVAHISAQGIITGRKAGVTRASVAMSDGRGGQISRNYQIHVIKKEDEKPPDPGERLTVTASAKNGRTSVVWDGGRKATVRYAAKIHHDLTRIWVRDQKGHTYIVRDKAVAPMTSELMQSFGEDTALSELSVAIDETRGVIQIANIDTSLHVSVEFKKDRTYQVKFYTEPGGKDCLYQVNDGLYNGNYIGKAPRENPGKAGYRFLGWSLDGTGRADQRYNGRTRISGRDITYYAIWEKK